jgi:hypothetical protein
VVAIEDDADFVEEERAVKAPKCSTLAASRKLLRTGKRQSNKEVDRKVG